MMMMTMTRRPLPPVVLGETALASESLPPLHVFFPTESSGLWTLRSVLNSYFPSTSTLFFLGGVFDSKTMAFAILFGYRPNVILWLNLVSVLHYRVAIISLPDIAPYFHGRSL
jgi:hypothetical protein